MSGSSDAVPSPEEERGLRAALQDAIGQICTEEEVREDSSDAAAHMSSDAVVALSELVYQYATTCLSSDLVSFSKHAGRRTIQMDDVLLVARKDPDGLLSKLSSFQQELLGSKGGGSSAATAAVHDDRAGVSPTAQRMREMRTRLLQEMDSADEGSSNDTETDDEDNAFATREKSRHTTAVGAALSQEHSQIKTYCNLEDSSNDGSVVVVAKDENDGKDDAMDDSSSSDEEDLNAALRNLKRNNQGKKKPRNNSVISRVLAENSKKNDLDDSMEDLSD